MLAAMSVPPTQGKTRNLITSWRISTSWVLVSLGARPRYSIHSFSQFSDSTSCHQNPKPSRNCQMIVRGGTGRLFNLRGKPSRPPPLMNFWTMNKVLTMNGIVDKHKLTKFCYWTGKRITLRKNWFEDFNGDNETRFQVQQEGAPRGIENWLGFVHNDPSSEAH